MIMKKIICLFTAIILCLGLCACTSTEDATGLYTDAKTKTRWMDRVTTYNDKGEKLEEIEYNRYGQAWRKTFEYGPNGKIVKETEYDDRDKVVMIRKFEHNPDNTKKKQYNYSPKGHLLTVKIFEYSYDGPEAEN